MLARTFIRDEHGIEVIIVASGTRLMDADTQDKMMKNGDKNTEPATLQRSIASSEQPQPQSQPSQQPNGQVTEEQPKGHFTGLNDAHAMYNSFFQEVLA